MMVRLQLLLASKEFRRIQRTLQHSVAVVRIQLQLRSLPHLMPMSAKFTQMSMVYLAQIRAQFPALAN